MYNKSIIWPKFYVLFRINDVSFLLCYAVYWDNGAIYFIMAEKWGFFAPSKIKKFKNEAQHHFRLLKTTGQTQ